MSYPQHPEDRPPPNSPHNAKNPPNSLALRLNRAANDLNPFLMVLAVGLLFLNITLYIGMAVAREPFAWTPPRENNSFYQRPAVSPAAFGNGSPVSAAGN